VPFFNQVAIIASTSALDAVNALNSAGDAMLADIIYHSDHLELSEQFNRSTGYELSVTDLTWSYAAFMSAVRAKTDQPVQR
jgi:glucoamylase